MHSILLSGALSTQIIPVLLLHYLLWSPLRVNCGTTCSSMIVDTAVRTSVIAKQQRHVQGLTGSLLDRFPTISIQPGTEIEAGDSDAGCQIIFNSQDSAAIEELKNSDLTKFSSWGARHDYRSGNGFVFSCLEPSAVIAAQWERYAPVWSIACNYVTHVSVVRSYDWIPQEESQLSKKGWCVDKETIRSKVVHKKHRECLDINWSKASKKVQPWLAPLTSIEEGYETESVAECINIWSTTANRRSPAHMVYMRLTLEPASLTSGSMAKQDEACADGPLAQDLCLVSQKGPPIRRAKACVDVQDADLLTLNAGWSDTLPETS